MQQAVERQGHNFSEAEYDSGPGKTAVSHKS